MHSGESGESEEKACCQRLLFEAYSNIGEPDGVYGVGTGYSSDVATTIKAYEHEKEFGKALCKCVLLLLYTSSGTRHRPKWFVRRPCLSYLASLSS